MPAGDSPSLSSASTFPGAAYAPYAAPHYVWNPYGSGLGRQRIDVPVVLISNNTAADAARRTDANGAKVSDAAMHTAVSGC
jgi:hypothetical protein